jgi:hypothetical protein
MKYVVEMGLGARIYVPRFRETGLGILKFIDGATHRQQSGLISLLLFFQNKKSRLRRGGLD